MKARFNRELLEVMLHTLPQGVSVANADLQLVAWNERYVELFGYPPGFLRAGRPVADLLLFNARRGWCGPGDPHSHAERRLALMRSGRSYASERRLPDGKIIEVRGHPLPDGGFMATFSDITRLRRIETDSRLLAAASHDLMQPVNAARLFNATLRSRADHDEGLRTLAERVENSLVAAEELLDGLMDIARLDSTAFQPKPACFAVAPLLKSLQDQFTPLARMRGITLRVRHTRVIVHTDHGLLRRVLQNLISNALRYTSTGRVVIGVRRRAGGRVELQVCDTGPGIAPQHHDAVFEEFRRLQQQSPWGEHGLGIGLSICKRIASILDAPLTLRSQLGRGSVFGVRVRRAANSAARAPREARIPALFPLVEPLSARRPAFPADPARGAERSAPPAFDYSRRTSP